MDIGITDDNVRDIYSALEECQVVVLVGPTGSGKSTFVPYRLLYPLAPYTLNHFTRNGPIIVTQPRIQATRNVPDAIAQLLVGCSVGPGFEIGYRHGDSGAKKDGGDNFDSRNRLVFVTDGSLINWLTDEKGGQFSIIMIDEAHERSCNIDLILALLKGELRKHPQLRLIIASATIDSKRFVEFYEETTTVRLLEFDGRREHGYEVQWWQGAESDDSVAMVSQTILDVLQTTEAGGILAFLPGKKEIEAAVDIVRRSIGNRADVRVSPLYAGLGVVKGRDALALLKPVRIGSRTFQPRRVVIATNIAETSLTVPDVVFVIDSGLIRQSEWNSTTCRQELITRFHSKDGCKQRWGRAGRVRHGIVFTTYSQRQFEAFPDHTTPEIGRSCLDQTLLTAHVAGVADPKGLSWLETPPPAESTRSMRALAARGIIDGDGDLTEEGIELYRLAQIVGRHVERYDFNSTNRGLDVATLLVLADRFGCLIEAATALVMAPRMGDSLYWREHGLLIWDRSWDLISKDRISQLHHALRVGCSDDWDFAIKLFSLAEVSEEWRSRNLINSTTFSVMLEARDGLLEAFAQGRNTVGTRPLDLRLLSRLRLLFPVAWPDRICTISSTDPHTFEFNGTRTGGVISRQCAGVWAPGDQAVVSIMDRNERAFRYVAGTYVEVPVANCLCRVVLQNHSREIATLTLEMARLRNGNVAEASSTHLFTDQQLPIGARVEVSAIGSSLVVNRMAEFPRPFIPQSAEMTIVDVPPPEEFEVAQDVDLYEHEALSDAHVRLRSGRLTAKSSTLGTPILDPLHSPLAAERRSGSPLDTEAFVVGWKRGNSGLVPRLAGDLPSPLMTHAHPEIPEFGRFRVRVVEAIYDDDPQALVGFLLESDGNKTFPVPVSSLSISTNHPGLSGLLFEEVELVALGLDTSGRPRLSRVPLLEQDLNELLLSSSARAVVARMGRNRRGSDIVSLNIVRERKMFHSATVRLADVHPDRRLHLEIGTEVLISTVRSTPSVGSFWTVTGDPGRVGVEETRRFREADIEIDDHGLRCRKAPSFQTILELGTDFPSFTYLLRRLFEVTHTMSAKIHEVGPSLASYDRLLQRATSIRAQAGTSDAKVTKSALIGVQTDLTAAELGGFARQQIRTVLNHGWVLQKVALHAAEIKKLEGWIASASGDVAERYRGFLEDHRRNLKAAQAELLRYERL